MWVDARVCGGMGGWLRAGPRPTAYGFTCLWRRVLPADFSRASFVTSAFSMAGTRSSLADNVVQTPGWLLGNLARFVGGRSLRLEDDGAGIAGWCSDCNDDRSVVLKLRVKLNTQHNFFVHVQASRFN